LNAAELTGQVSTHVVAVSEPPCVVHVDVRAPFAALRRSALKAGIDLQPVSSFRDFARQLDLWNGKFTGARPLYDAGGRPLDATLLTEAERVQAILEWSALPGASRHHWGTDLDLIDASAVPPGYHVQLTAAEYSSAGPFARLAEWLSEHAAQFGFFRPFRGVLSGVQAEPWHFSFAPAAEPARRALEPRVLEAALRTAPLLGKEHVLERLDELHARYVAAIDFP
jgi:LAS superfamily LD-carboxypeptidase LdcB